MNKSTNKTQHNISADKKDIKKNVSSENVKKKSILLPLLLAFILPVLLYLQTTKFALSGFDDTTIISENKAYLSDFSNIGKAFLTDAFIVKKSPFLQTFANSFLYA